MKKLFKNNPYLRIYLIVLIYAGLLFGWGKLTRDVEWYLDTTSLWVSIIGSVVGIGLSAVLIYFRYAPEKTQNPGQSAIN